MPTILCFGDSNTWGTVPNESRRYSENERWPALLSSALADNATVIEEGQQGRTIVHNNPFQGEKSGQRYLKDCLDAFVPDLVIILLGTNDLKKRFALSADAVAQSASELALKVLQYKSRKVRKEIQVLLIAPPKVIEVGSYAKLYQGAAQKSQVLAGFYERYAKEIGCAFFDAGTVVTPCLNEGVHWPLEQHQLLASALLPVIHEIVDLP